MARANYQASAQIYKILSAQSRVRVLKATDGLKTVLEIATELKMPYTYVSRILFSLAERGFLKANTNGTHKMYYVHNARMKTALDSMSVEREGELVHVAQRENPEG
jgi:DNA-binding transcriptional ArsR family regulator